MKLGDIDPDESFARSLVLSLVISAAVTIAAFVVLAAFGPFP
jgi:hypothetical protein